MISKNRVALTAQQRALSAAIERIEADAKREGRGQTEEETAQSDALAAALATLTRQINAYNDVTASPSHADAHRGHELARGPPPSGESFLRWRQVAAKTGLSRASVWRAVRAGTFPGTVPLMGPHAVGWIESEIETWIAARIALRDQRESRSVRKSSGRARKVAASVSTDS